MIRVSNPDVGKNTSWVDALFEENADKCVYKYGQTSPTPSGGTRYNMQLNDKYFMIQQNWDIVTQRCSSG